ncbi:hypothetical protein AAFF_G00431870 [Aldrovandia affinis]|uniref:Large ribosomal subunit protein uL1m n=1 Tax=Aldrovandia affinis TaxID=143900 RepID=A0AAD7S8V7_9TELE|nr:hypothetical protein AAFF_G00431870 [Aldrovandia affinis]
MAACTRTIAKVLTGCHRHLLTPCGQVLTNLSQTAPRRLPARTFAAVKSAKKGKKEEQPKPKVEKERNVDDPNRHKPYGLTAWFPVDDVYLTRHYPKPVYNPSVAIDMLKKFQQLDFTYSKQLVYLDLKLDMKLEKKTKVDPFVSTVHLPYQLKTEINKVLVFSENADQAKLAEESNAAFVGGEELIQKVLDDEVQADFYLAVPDIMNKLHPLKNKLRKKFPKNKRGTVGVNILKMLELFKTGHEYLVERDCYILTKIATLDMPMEHILANMQEIISDVCTYRPARFGPFVERAIICSATSEGLHLNCQQFLPSIEEE